MLYQNDSLRKAKLDFYNYLADKKVIIVGPAYYLKGKQLGGYIDNFDIVVRISEPMHRGANVRDYGSRIDIIYLPPSLSQVLIGRDKNFVVSWSKAKLFSANEILRIYNRWGKYNVKFVIGRKAMLKKDSYVPFKYVLMPEKFVKSVDAKAETHITMTGVLVMMHLLRSRVKEVHVVGFDFYRTGYFHSKRDWKIGKGKLTQKQILFLKEVAEKEERLVLDEVLWGVLNEADEMPLS